MNKFITILSGILLILPFAVSGQIVNQRTGTQYRQLKSAIQMAGDHDVLLVKGGFYEEGNITVRKPLTLRGTGGPVLDGSNQNEILTIKADSVLVEGFIIQNVGVSYMKDQAGIRLYGSRGSVIRNNKLKNTFFGILLEKSVHCKVENNEITGNAASEVSSGNAIHLWYCDSMLIRANEVRRHRDGIYLEFVNASMIQENVSENNLRYGLHFMFSDDDTYLKNTFRNNGAGVAVMFSNHITMDQNLFANNWGASSYGLLLKEITDSKITDNKFQQNTSAIYAEGANRCLVTGNDFIRNGWAMKISGNCENNTFTQNNFLSNTFDLSTNSKQNYNSYNGNYWSEYTGYDLNRDGTGDVPYQPVKLYSYIVDRSDASIILLRSFFIDLLNYAEKVAPAITPASLVDSSPLMKPIP